MRRLIEIQREAEKDLGVYTLSTDYEIMYILMDMSAISPEELRKHTRLASTAFYNRIAELERSGAVISDVNPEDRRGRLYRLSDDMRTLILNQHAGYMDLVHQRVESPEKRAHSLDIYHSYIRKGKIVNHLTADFQIILYLYLKSGISNLNISNVVDVSITKFNNSLTKLTRLGLVHHCKDPSDGRSKLYHLSDRALSVLDTLHERVWAWLKEKAKPIARPSQ